MKKVCSTPRCPNLTERTYCSKCEPDKLRDERARYDAKRPGARQRGYDAEWEKLSKEVLQEEPICRQCKRRPSKIADHIRPIRDGGARLDRRNLQGLCWPCHEKKKVAERRRRAAK